MLLTAPDSVKIFIMFLLLQSLVCALGRYPQARGMGVCGRLSFNLISF